MITFYLVFGDVFDTTGDEVTNYHKVKRMMTLYDTDIVEVRNEDWVLVGYYVQTDNAIRYVVEGMGTESQIVQHVAYSGT